MYFLHHQGKKRKVIEETYEEHETCLLYDKVNKKWKAVEKTSKKHEAHLLCDRDRKHEVWQKVKETHKKLEACLMTKEEARYTYTYKKYQLRKARKTFKQCIVRITQFKSNVYQNVL